MNIIKTDQTRMIEEKVYRNFREIVDAAERGHLSIMYKKESVINVEFNNPPFNHIRKSMKSRLTEARSAGNSKDFIPYLYKYQGTVIDGMLTSWLIKYHGCKAAVMISKGNVPDLCLHRTPETDNMKATINGILVSKKSMMMRLMKNSS